MNVRPVHISDLNALMQLEAECFPTEAFPRRTMRYLIQKSRSVFLVLENQGQLLGSVCLLTPKRHRSARIYSLSVTPTQQGKRLGQQLMDQMLSIARERGYSGIHLEVDEENDAAIRLYLRNGFQPIGHIRGYYNNGHNALKMHRDLLSV